VDFFFETERIWVARNRVVVYIQLHNRDLHIHEKKPTKEFSCDMFMKHGEYSSDATEVLYTYDCTIEIHTSMQTDL